MTREEMDFIGSMNMCDEISNEAYQKIMTHCEEQEPCEDAISRQFMYELGATCIAARDKNGKLIALGAIEELPSVTPQQRTGRWIKCDVLQEVKCSECRKCFRHKTKYCPNCGAKMEVEE